MIPVLSRDGCLEALRKMLLIRRFEEACIDAAHKGQVPGHFHVYIGQEATGVGVMSVLDKGDYVHCDAPQPWPPAGAWGRSQEGAGGNLGQGHRLCGGQGRHAARLRARPEFSR